MHLVLAAIHQWIVARIYRSEMVWLAHLHSSITCKLISNFITFKTIFTFFVTSDIVIVIWLSQVLRLLKDRRLFLPIVTTFIKGSCILLLIIEFISLSAEPLICSSCFLSWATSSLNMFCITYEVNLTRCFNFLGLMIVNPFVMVLSLSISSTFLVRAIFTTRLHCCLVFSFVRG